MYLYRRRYPLAVKRPIIHFSDLFFSVQKIDDTDVDWFTEGYLKRVLHDEIVEHGV